MLIAHKITLDLNNCQATYMARAAGTARFAYNWALAQWKRQYEAWQLDNSQPKPSQAALRRQLNSIKREQFPWIIALQGSHARRANSGGCSVVCQQQDLFSLWAQVRELAAIGAPVEVPRMWCEP